MKGYVLAFLMFLGSATAVPLAGPARVADLAFIIAAIFCAKGAYRRVLPPGSPLVGMVNVLLAVMATGFLSWTAQLVFAPEDVIFGGLATAIQIPGAIICSLLIGLQLADEKIIDRCGQISLVFNICLLVMLALFLVGLQPGFLIVDYTTTDRFSALSSNPNQIGLVMVPLPFFSYIAFKYGRKRASVAVFEIVSVIAVNYFSFGKTLFIAWIFLFVPIIFFDLIRRGALERLILIPLAIGAAPFALYQAYLLLARFYEGNARGSVEGQGQNRLLLWQNGLRAWLDAPVIGHGPGSFSGETAPYQGAEAHNTIVDWLASYGVVGASCLLAMYIVALRAGVQRRNLLLIGLLASVAVQAFTQFYGRSPYYWLWWIVGAAIAQRLAVPTAADLRAKGHVGKFALA